MTTDLRDAFPLVSERIPISSSTPSGPETRPWILQFARTPDAHQAQPIPEAVYDDEQQVSVGLYGGELPCMGTHFPTIPDGSADAPPPLDEGPKD
ncbi:hypothetical protein [Streptomyces megasporus]|uniref:hypothetical protein n=1 Tax=Streptomyces megasporus TaxID=44060 RepID=UPI0004E282A8|nr:hypothetical protein [Streptomyces megasporus]